MKSFKKIWIGGYGLFLAAILAIVAGIIYAVNGGDKMLVGQNPNAATLVPLFNIFAGVFFILAVIIAILPLKGIAGKLGSVCTMALIVVGGLFLGLAAINSVQAFVYDLSIEQFSDLHAGDDMSAIHGAVASAIISGIALVLAGIFAFFGLRRGDEEAEVAKQAA